MAAKNRIKQDQRDLVGQRVRLLGNGKRTCLECGKKLNKGMVSRVGDDIYCSESCVLIQHSKG